MKNLIHENVSFIKKELLTDDIVETLMRQGLEEKALLFEQQGGLYSSLYFLKELGNYFYGNLLPSTDYISNFGLVPYFDGLLLQIPKPENFNELQPVDKLNKLFGIYQQHKDWAEILKVSTIGNLNDFTLQKRSGEIIKISEALHEKRIAEIANEIYSRNGDIKIVLVAGPSASGKTTFSKRLGVQLAVNGLHPYQISMDNYFVDREKTPHDEFGNYDFEALEAIDIEFFNSQLLDLFDGKEIQLPSLILTGANDF